MAATSAPRRAFSWSDCSAYSCTETLQRLNAIKNVLAGLVNLVAAILFMFTTHMDYAAAGLIAAGSIIGGLIGRVSGAACRPPSCGS